MSDSKANIIKSLESVNRPFSERSDLSDRLSVAQFAPADLSELVERFIQEAERLNIHMHRVSDAEQALDRLMDLLEGIDAVSCWAFDRIPLVGLQEALVQADITVAPPDDAHVETGITGADAALAATGTLVLGSGAGRPRSPSLLPPVHIAVITTDQIVPTLEHWVERQRKAGLDTLRASSNVILISGPSRTADIAMTLVMGMHGPKKVHIILVDNQPL